MGETYLRLPWFLEQQKSIIRMTCGTCKFLGFEFDCSLVSHCLPTNCVCVFYFFGIFDGYRSYLIVYRTIIWVIQVKNTEIYIYHISGQIITTSAQVTLNGGLVRKSPQNPLNSGLGIILICPDIYIYIIPLCGFRFLSLFLQVRFLQVPWWLQDLSKKISSRPCYASSEVLRTSRHLGGGNSNLFGIFAPIPGGNDPIWRSYFSNGLVQPPTRHFFYRPFIHLAVWRILYEKTHSSSTF